MKKTLFLLTVVGLALPAVAAPLDFHENWDGYLAGSANRFEEPYKSTWPDMTGVTNRYPVETAQNRSSPNSLLVHNTGWSDIKMAITHDLGGEWQATDENPIVVEFYLRIPGGNSHRRHLDLSVELSKDDAIAPGESGGAANVIAFGMPRSVRDAAASWFFDGATWANTGLAPTGANWQQFKMTVKSNEIGFLIGDSSNSGFVRTYTGTFTQINIRHVSDGGTGAAYLDDLSVTGGVLVPEPATALMLLGLGGLFLRRRRG